MAVWQNQLKIKDFRNVVPSNVFIVVWYMIIMLLSLNVACLFQIQVFGYLLYIEKTLLGITLFYRS